MATADEIVDFDFSTVNERENGLRRASRRYSNLSHARVGSGAFTGHAQRPVDCGRTRLSHKQFM